MKKKNILLTERDVNLILKSLQEYKIKLIEDSINKHNYEDIISDINLLSRIIKDTYLNE